MKILNIKLLKALIFCQFLGTTEFLFAQSISVQPTGAIITQNASSGKVLTSNAQGVGTWQAASNYNVGLQILTTPQRLSITNPIAGTKVFDSDNGQKMIFDGTEWQVIETESLVYPPLVQKKNNDAQTFDSFGNCVVMENETVVVGAKEYDNGKGAAYVFQRINGSWNQVAKLTANDGMVGDKFGIKVAMLDNLIVVRSLSNGNSNAIYLFKKQSGTWTQFAKLSPNIADTFFDNSSSFGSALSITKTGNNYTVLVGVPLGNSTKGSVYNCLANPDNNTASFVAKIEAEDGMNSDYFGASVFVSPANQQLIVGAIGRNNYAGKVYFYNKLALGAWANTASETKTGTAANTYLGAYIMGSSTHLAINNTSNNQPMINLYEWNNGQWNNHPIDPNHPFDGIPLCVSDNYLICSSNNTQIMNFTFKIAKFTPTNWSATISGDARVLIRIGSLGDILAGINADGRFVVSGYNLVSNQEVNKLVFGFGGY